jgi:mono/diheme cytochrome c family protein
MHGWFPTSSILVLLSTAFAAQTPDPAAVDRGRKALTERAFLPAAWSWSAYENLWKVDADKDTQKPADYEHFLRERYGLPPAPFANQGLPLGLRESTTIFFQKGVTTDCMLCHGGSLFGKSYVGLGSSSLDMQALFEDLNRAEGRPAKLPFTFSQVRGTMEAGAMAVYLLAFREPNLDVRFTRRDFVLRDDLCEDTPAWWLLKKKKTMYYTGTSHARSVRSIMQFMLSPTNPRQVFEREEKTFGDIQAYLLSLEAPKYPFPIDAELAGRGHKLFEQKCARCHGTYGPDGVYPNKVIEVDVIGTDRSRFDGIPRKVGEFYNQSWFAHEKGDDGYPVVEPIGYQAPPLDGVWATAPYLHNGSLPTLYDILNSNTRPRIFTRSYRTEVKDYDTDKLGWKVRVLDSPPDAKLPAAERRKIYDTTRPGRGNGGHTFGDAFTEPERRAVLEYLKTL